MNPIKAKVYSGEEKPEQCHITKQAFIKEPGLEYYTQREDSEGKKVDVPVSPAVAHRKGFEFEKQLAPPSTVQSKSDLTQWLTGLGLKSYSANYRQLYKDFAGLFEYHEIRNGKGYL